MRHDTRLVEGGLTVDEHIVARHKMAIHLKDINASERADSKVDENGRREGEVKQFFPSSTTHKRSYTIDWQTFLHDTKVPC